MDAANQINFDLIKVIFDTKRHLFYNASWRPLCNFGYMYPACIVLQYLAWIRGIDILFIYYIHVHIYI